MKKFRIYAKRGRDARYYLVYVCRTRAQMYHHRERIERGLEMPPLGRDFAACATAFATDVDPLCFGILMFYLGEISARIISHELTHAAIYWFNRTFNGFDWEEIQSNKAAEEEFATLQGELVREFYLQWWPRCEAWSKLGNTPQNMSGT